MASRSASMKRLVNALGKLSWGTTACAVFVVCAATAITLPAQVTTLFTFDGTHGASPYAGLVQATDGDLYGTTWGGGAKNAGTVFKITPAGILTTLYSFCSQTNCTDGAEAEAGLFQAANGDLYGTTFYGGSHNHGTVFRITPTGTLTTLYSFCSQSGCADGDLPLARLVQAANRDLYGTTTSGGTHDGGTVFKINPSGTLTTLYSFCSQSACTDGLQPVAGLVQLANGDFYGTTQYGGANSYGTVFKITPSGKLTTRCRFVCAQSGCPDGVDPTAGLVQAANGDLYGTTQLGGANSYGGTVFKITPSGTLTTLYSFLLPRQLSKLPGRRTTVCGTPPSRRRGPLRDNAVWWGQQLRWDGLQDHFEWHADDAIQLLLPKRVPGRHWPLPWARPGHQWGLLRDNVFWRFRRRRHRFPPVGGSGPVCENAASLRRGGSSCQDSGDQSDQRDQR